MSKSITSNEIRIKREEVRPGVFLEHYQQMNAKSNLYLIKVEVLVFRTLELVLDFSESSNVEIRGNKDSMVKTLSLDPYSKVTVATLILGKNWVVRVKAKVDVRGPPLEFQREFMATHSAELDEAIKQNKNFLANIDLLAVPAEHTFALLNKFKINFVDLDFPPLDASWRADIIGFQKAYNTVVHWRRAKYLYLPFHKAADQKATVPCFYKTASGTDHCDSKKTSIVTESAITSLSLVYDASHKHEAKTLSKANAIEDRYLRSGRTFLYHLRTIFEALKKHPQLLDSIFEGNQCNRQGFYRLSLFKMGRRRPVVVDDYIPCRPYSWPLNASLAAEEQPEFGLLLIEKAFAKLRGGYQMIGSPHLKALLSDLVGLPVIEREVEKADSARLHLWEDILQWTNRQFIIFAERAEALDDSVSIQANDCLPRASYFSVVKAEASPTGEKVVTLSLTENSSFSFSSEEEIEEHWSKCDGELGRSMARLDAASMKVQPTVIELPFDHFTKEFQKLYTVQPAYNHKVNLKGMFSPAEASNDGHSALDFWMSRYSYKLEVKTRMDLAVMIHQEDEQLIGVKESRPYIDIGLVVFKEVNGELICHKCFPPQKARSLTAQLDLQPEAYLIVPYTLSAVAQSAEEFEKKKKSHLTKDDPAVVAALADAFEKFNISGSNQLSFKELLLFFKTFGMDLDEPLFKSIASKYTCDEPACQYEHEGLGEKGFSRLFFNLLSNGKLGDSVFEAFRRLGYDESMFCFGPRLFGLSFFASEYINLEWKGSFESDLDTAILKALLQSQGVEITRAAKDDCTSLAVLAYLNK